jgi:hypothetical protein
MLAPDMDDEPKIGKGFSRAWIYLGLAIVAGVIAFLLVMRWYDRRAVGVELAGFEQIAADYERCLFGDAIPADADLAQRSAALHALGTLDAARAEACRDAAETALERHADLRTSHREEVEPIWSAVRTITPLGDGRWRPCESVDDLRGVLAGLRARTRADVACLLPELAQHAVTWPGAPDGQHWRVRDYLHADRSERTTLPGEDLQFSQQTAARTRDGLVWEQLTAPRGDFEIQWRDDDAWAFGFVGPRKPGWAHFHVRDGDGWRAGASVPAGDLRRPIWARTAAGWVVVLGPDVDGAGPVLHRLDATMTKVETVALPPLAASALGGAIVASTDGTVARFTLSGTPDKRSLDAHVLAPATTTAVTTSLALGAIAAPDARPPLRTCKRGDSVFVVAADRVVAHTRDLGRRLEQLHAGELDDPIDLDCTEDALWLVSATKLTVCAPGAGCVAEPLPPGSWDRFALVARPGAARLLLARGASSTSPAVLVERQVDRAGLTALGVWALAGVPRRGGYLIDGVWYVPLDTRW